MQRRRDVLVLAVGVCVAAAAGAEEHERLGEVVVEARQPRSAASSDEIGARTFELRPHATLQEILNNVPGVVVRQHQGGGKAAQYLVRGFNADHGTDFLVTVDGLPVNLVTHAHGQGYADANFVIPETIETLQVRKGPYFPELGDLAVAGALNLVTKAELDEDFVRAEGGSFDRQRYVLGWSPRLGAVKTLLAGQAYASNGPFLHAERFARYNGFARFTLEPTPDAKLWASGTVYAANWDASGQIPQRLVSAGRLDRFGSLDPSEGGRTDRQNLDVHYDWTPTARDALAVQAWASRYTLRLWSYFTFFQETGLRFFARPDGTIVDARGGSRPPRGRAVPGDGIEQSDARWLWGARASWLRTWAAGAVPMGTRLGVETRSDEIDVAVHRQVRRRRFFTVNRSRVVERSVSGYLAQQIDVTDWLRFDGGLRGDWFSFDVDDRLPRQRRDPSFRAVPIEGRATDGLVSPKANLVLTPEPATDVYLNFGTGFHSNDARGVVQAEQAGDRDFVPLARALGYEVGVRTRKLDRIDAAAAVWLLDLESEIVFCGDCGFIERGDTGSFAVQGETRRWGVDVETRVELLPWLFLDHDLSWADPRFADGRAIPIAPTLAMNGGVTAALANGLSAAFRVRYLDDRPATEDRRLPARGYLVVDLLAQYRWRNVELGLDLLNLGDVDWQEAVFADTSCTAREVRTGRCGNPRGPREDIHFTPGDPFGVRGRLTVFF